MKKYIKKQIQLVNYEREAEIQLMLNEIKKLSAKKREKLGRAINNVKGKNLGQELGYHIVQYGRKQPIDTEISVGDLVLVSFGNPLKSNLTGTVTEKGTHFIKLAMEDLPKWALKKHVRLDLYANDITFRRMEENLSHLSTKGKNALEYILTQRQPQKSSKELLNKKYNFIDNSLNNSQKEAIIKSIASKNFFLIHGPFGTGKTRTLIELIKQECLLGSKILVTAESNTAIDNILERLMDFNDYTFTRLGHPQRVDKNNITYSLAYKVENHPLNKKINNLKQKLDDLIERRDQHQKPTPRYKRGYSLKEIHSLGVKKRGGRGIKPEIMSSMAKWIEKDMDVQEVIEEIRELEDKIIAKIITESDVILSTNSSAALEVIANINFDVAIIDEASQATIPSVLIPIAKARKFILAGDHKQLPPTIISDKAQDLEDTLFEKLINSYPEKSELLNVQYRMNSSLMDFPNKEFYSSKLSGDENLSKIGIEDIVKIDNVDGLSKLEKMLISNKNPIMFIDTANLDKNFEKHLKDSKSIINISESKITLKIANFYEKLGIDSSDIGIISPYADQVNLIKDKTAIETKTVDGFQGREKEIIIISTVRSNEKGKIGFLSDLRRLNVAITRSKRKLIIIGNSKTLSNDSTYNRLIESIYEKNSLVTISKKYDLNK